MRRVFICFLEEIEDSKKAFRNYLTFKSRHFMKLILIKIFAQDKRRNLIFNSESLTTYILVMDKTWIKEDWVRFFRLLTSGDSLVSLIHLSLSCCCNWKQSQLFLSRLSFYSVVLRFLTWFWNAAFWAFVWHCNCFSAQRSEGNF